MNIPEFGSNPSNLVKTCELSLAMCGYNGEWTHVYAPPLLW